MKSKPLNPIGKDHKEISQVLTDEALKSFHIIIHQGKKVEENQLIVNNFLLYRQKEISGFSTKLINIFQKKKVV